MRRHVLAVPYYSQRLDVEDSFWCPRSCGIVALKMAMDYASQKQSTSIARLIEEGVASGAHDPKHGWIHEGLIKLARRHGFKKSFRKEWSENEKSKALRYIVVLLRKNIPALASFKSKAGGHLVLLTGFQNLKFRKSIGNDSLDFLGIRGFFYHDPNSYARRLGKNKFISTAQFLKSWRGRIIVVQ